MFLDLFQKFGDGFEHLASYLAKDLHLLLIRSFRFGGIYKTVMDAFPCFPGPHRAFLRGRIANGYNEIEVFRLQFIDLL